MNTIRFFSFPLFPSVFLSVFSFQFSAFAQGPLTPPGTPAPTMKSLDQIEPRTPIASLRQPNDCERND